MEKPILKWNVVYFTDDLKINFDFDILNFNHENIMKVIVLSKSF